jgi:hypothetical protein
MTGKVIGDPRGRAHLQLAHPARVRDGLVSREQVWIDSAAIME